MKKLVLAVTLLALCSLGRSQILSAASGNNQPEATAWAKNDAAGAAPDRPFATTTCSFKFTSGANNTFLQYCVTVNGNILQLQTPLGHFHIAPTTGGEGYGVCDVAGGGINYSDYGNPFFTTDNWNPARLVSHSGTSLKIARTTSDGIWTLTQTITQVSANSSINIVMALKNNTAVARTVDVLRYADVDADSQFQNNLDGTHNTAMAWTSTSAVDGFGLMLQKVGASTFAYDAFAQKVAHGPNACNYAENFAPGVLPNVDGSLVLAYVGTVPANGTKTFNMTYRGF